ncbi:MAG: hypothetical protein IJ649_00135 [Oscillospiraceae bacterium]|nr:hypothetical protein [Oscillospiraceae bacterium]
MILVWHVYHGVMVEKRRRLRRNRFFTHWQEIDNEAWISVKDRAPTRDDADVYNCVIARNRWGDMMTAGWHRFAHETDLTDWQHPPAPPEDFLGLREKYEEEELH